MNERDHKAKMLRRARHYRQMARRALEASRVSISSPASMLVMAQEWYSLALQIENTLPRNDISGRHAHG